MSAYDDQVLIDGAVGYWVGNAALGATTEADLSGKAHPGTYTSGYTLGATGPLSDLGKAFSVDGTGYLTMGDVAVIDPTQAFSVEFWFKSLTATGYLISKFNTVSANGWQVILVAGVLRFKGWDAASAVVLSLDTDGTYNDGGWHHLVATWNGGTATGGIVISADGVAVKSGAATAKTMGSASGIALLAGINSALAQGVSATLGRIAIYQRALTAAQIANHYALRTFGPSMAVAARLRGVY